MILPNKDLETAVQTDTVNSYAGDTPRLAQVDTATDGWSVFFTLVH